MILIRNSHTSVTSAKCVALWYSMCIVRHSHSFQNCRNLNIFKQKKKSETSTNSIPISSSPFYLCHGTLWWSFGCGSKNLFHRRPSERCAVGWLCFVLSHGIYGYIKDKSEMRSGAMDLLATSPAQFHSMALGSARAAKRRSRDQMDEMPGRKAYWMERPCRAVFCVCLSRVLMHPKQSNLELTHK